MSDGANVQRIEIFHELNSSFAEFSNSVATELSSIQHEIGEVLEWLEERDRHWRAEVQRCEAELQAAKRAYLNCMAQPPDKDGRKPNCHDQAMAVNLAQKARDNAQRELTNVITWKGKLKSQIAFYVEQAARLQRVANNVISQGSSFLRKKAGELGDYRSASAPNAITSIGGHGYQYAKAKQEMLLRALDDPLISRDIKGWIRNELRRMENLDQLRGNPERMQTALQHINEIQNATSRSRSMSRIMNNNEYIRMPPMFDAGHRNHSVDHWANLRFEDIWLNRSRYHRAVRLGIQDRIR